MARSCKYTVVFLFIYFLAGTRAFSGGLSTTFIEERLKDLTPGETYSIEKEMGRPVVVMNTTEDQTVTIAIEPEKPVEHNLVSGYEPIPDISWVKIKKGYFENVGPGESVETDILISIPKDRRHYDKKYQVYIYSHTAGKESFRMGLMSRVFLETRKLPEKTRRFQLLPKR